MAISISSAPSFPVSKTRVLSSMLLGAFLFLSYRVISGEVSAFQDSSAEPSAAPAMQQPAPDQSTPQAEPNTGDGSVQPRKRSHEGSRREWYEKRARRWFTPPKVDLDRGLPAERATFKVA